MTSADLTEYAREHRFEVSADELPPNARPLAALAYERLGFYLIGLVPIVRVDLRDGVKKLVAEARALGADGLAHLRYEYRPAAVFRFVVFPLPDWSASVTVTAVAYANASSPQPRPLSAEPGPDITAPPPPQPRR